MIVNKQSIAIMIVIILTIVLSAQDNEKKIKNEKKSNKLVYNNKTVVIRPKNSAVPACTETTQVYATCLAAYLGVLDELHETTFASADLITAVDAFITGCPVLACVASCKSLISNQAFAAADATLEGKIVSNCNPIPSATASPAPTANPAAVTPGDSGSKIMKTSSYMIAISILVAGMHLLQA
jgi:hypothetical protein